MADFNKAIPYILKNEGGFVDHPNDPGGATNMGISIRFLKDLPLEFADIDGDGDVDRQDIENMTKEDAVQLYRVKFWDNQPYGKIIDDTIAAKVFDLAVNMGPSRAHTLLQAALNEAFDLNIPTTGKFGPITLQAVNAIKDGGEEQKLLTAYSEQAWGFYQRLIQNKPNLAVFRNGWKNRAYALSKANVLG